MKVKIKKLHPDAIIPTYATDGSGCFDLYACEGGTLISSRVIDTGIGFEVPEGHVMLMFSRSGHGIKQGVRLSNCVGVIDSDYRNSVMVGLRIDTFSEMSIKKGDRIAQALILPVQQVQFEEVEALSETERGLGGLGSTGM